MRQPEGQTPSEIADLIQDIIKDKVVCDIGCGGGAFMFDMAKYAKEVVGIEEEEDWAVFAADRGFQIYFGNSFWNTLPAADVYYSWTKDSMGVFLKARHEGTKGTFIFGPSIRKSTKEFIQSLNPEVRGDAFKVSIVTI